jgi:cytochrome c biogenesis factor
MCIIGALISIGGLTLAILGIVARNLSDIENSIRQNQDKLIAATKLNFQQLGAIIMLFGVIVITITIVVVAKKVDLEEEKRSRRAQRLSLIMDGKDEEPRETEVEE